MLGTFVVLFVIIVGGNRENVSPAIIPAANRIIKWIKKRR